MIRFAIVSGIGMYQNLFVGWELDVGPSEFVYVAPVRTPVKMGFI